MEELITVRDQLFSGRRKGENDERRKGCRMVSHALLPMSTIQIVYCQSLTALGLYLESARGVATCR